MKRLTCILAIIWLGILSGQLVYAANSCPQDSVIGYSEDGTPISKIIYGYDDAGRTILEEIWYSNSDSVLYGSSKTTTEYYDNGKVKSTAYYTWSTETNDWKGTNRQDYVYNDQGQTTSRSELMWSTVTNTWRDSLKYEYTYNAKGSTLTYSTLLWSESQSMWTNVNRSEYTYNESNRKIKDLYLIGSGTTWTPKTKREYNYDQKGNMILDLYYSDYDAGTKQWIGDHWYKYAYDNGNRQTLIEQYSWDKDKKDWYGTQKVEYRFNAVGKPTLYIYYTWNTTTSTFDKSTENIYDYDQWNNTILQEQYQNKNGKWQGIGKIRYEYTAYNSDPIMKTTFAWDSIHNVFIGVDSVRLAKDAAGNQILDEHYVWSNNNWYGDKKEEFIYDAAKNVISKITYSWITESATWMYATRDSSQYNENKLPILEEHYTWSTADGGYWKGTGEKKLSEYTNNNETLKAVYIWDDAQKDWTYKSKIIKEYNGSQQTLYEEYQLQADGQFKGITKERYYQSGKKKTTVTFSWLHDEVWQGKDSTIADYDAADNQTLTEEYVWVEALQKWKGTTKSNYTYNSYKKVLTSQEWAWDNGTFGWVDSVKTEAKYDKWKNLIYDERYTYDRANSKWVGTLKKEYAYNEDGQQIMFANYTWNGSMFVGTQKEENERDDQGRLIMHAEYTWGTTTWKGTTKSEYTYNEENQITTEIALKWNSTTWVNNTKKDNTYTGTKVTSYILYNWVSGAWEKAKRWEQEDANTEYTYEWWNNDWSLTQKKAKEYDDQNRLIRELDENYSHGAQTSGSKTEYTYMGDNLTQKSSYTFNTDWVETDRITNTYDTDNRQTNTTTYTLVGSSLVYVSKTDTEYNGKNVITTSYTSPDGATWQGEKRDEKIYSNELDYTSTVSEWIGGAWVGISKIGYTFYSANKQKSILEYTWLEGDWQEYQLTEYEYSGTKNIVTTIYQKAAEEWVGQSKTGVYYDEGEAETNASWNWVKKTWVPVTKVGLTYYASGKLKSQTNYKASGSDFVPTTRVEYEYGEGDKDITKADYTWNGTKWVGQTKKGEVWVAGKQTQEISYKWVSDIDTWQYDKKTEWEYAPYPTIATFTWDETHPGWKGVSKSGEKKEGDRVLAELSFRWSETAWTWENDQMTEYTYGTGKNKTTAYYVGNGSEWVGKYKYEENYTDNGDSLSFYTKCWKDGAWADSLKTELTYDDHGNVTYRIYAQWKNDAWENQTTSTRWEITYDENDSIKVDAHYKWNRTKGWIGTGTRYEYTYSDGKLILYLQYTWYSNKWAYKYKYEWQYSENDSLTMNLYLQYNASQKTWILGTKYEYAYSTSGICTMSADYTWDTESKDWQGGSKNEKVLDQNDSIIANITYAWNFSLQQWEGSFKYEYKYDGQGRTLEQLVSRYNTTTGQWQYDTQDTYVYDSYGRTIESATNTWNNGTWIPRTVERYTYEEDPYTRLRIKLDATWSNGVIKKYEEKIYYYACDPKYTISVNTQESGIGEVSGGGVYTYYARPQLVATEEPNCNTFSQWSDGEIAAKRRIIVTADQTYIAEFTPIQHTIRASVSSAGGGSVRVAIKPE